MIAGRVGQTRKLTGACSESILRHVSTPFPPDALEANRRGELTQTQVQGFSELSRYQRRNGLKIAAWLLVGAVLIGFFASPSSSMVMRVLITLICLTIATFIFVRSMTGGDALSRDLKEKRVESIEGAMGKGRLSSSGRSASGHYIDVGDTRFMVAALTYQAAPEAGYVKLYYMPHSRKVVNLERLPDPPMTQGATVQELGHTLVTGIFSLDRRERNEARAAMAGLGNALRATFEQPAPPPAQTHDSRPLAEAIVGTWSNGFITASFSSDGHVTTNIMGRAISGKWSVDGDGRLCAEVTGERQMAEARVTGDQLTLSLQGRALTFTRRSPST